jgi:hypothetical protein
MKKTVRIGLDLRATSIVSYGKKPHEKVARKQVIVDAIERLILPRQLK